MTETRTGTIAYTAATALGLVIAYHIGRLIGHVNGYRNGYDNALGREISDDYYLGWGDIDGW